MTSQHSLGQTVLLLPFPGDSLWLQSADHLIAAQVAMQFSSAAPRPHHPVFKVELAPIAEVGLIQHSRLSGDQQCSPLPNLPPSMLTAVPTLDLQPAPCLSDLNCSTPASSSPAPHLLEQPSPKPDAPGQTARRAESLQKCLQAPLKSCQAKQRHCFFMLSWLPSLGFGGKAVWGGHLVIDPQQTMASRF